MNTESPQRDQADTSTIPGLGLAAPADEAPTTPDFGPELKGSGTPSERKKRLSRTAKIGIVCVGAAVTAVGMLGFWVGKSNIDPYSEENTLAAARNRLQGPIVDQGPTSPRPTPTPTTDPTPAAEQTQSVDPTPTEQAPAPVETNPTPSGNDDKDKAEKIPSEEEIAKDLAEGLIEELKVKYKTMPNTDGNILDPSTLPNKEKTENMPYTGGDGNEPDTPPDGETMPYELISDELREKLSTLVDRKVINHLQDLGEIESENNPLFTNIWDEAKKLIQEASDELDEALKLSASE